MSWSTTCHDPLHAMLHYMPCFTTYHAPLHVMLQTRKSNTSRRCEVVLSFILFINQFDSSTSRILAGSLLWRLSTFTLGGVNILTVFRKTHRSSFQTFFSPTFGHFPRWRSLTSPCFSWLLGFELRAKCALLKKIKTKEGDLVPYLVVPIDRIFPNGKTVLEICAHAHLPLRVVRKRRLQHTHLSTQATAEW